MAKVEKIYVMSVSPNKPAEMVEITNDLNSLQQAIGGGYIQIVPLKKGLLICDEDGIAKNLPDNKFVHPWGMIKGTFLICGGNKNSNPKSLPKELEEKYMKIYG